MKLYILASCACWNNHRRWKGSHLALQHVTDIVDMSITHRISLAQRVEDHAPYRTWPDEPNDHARRPVFRWTYSYSYHIKKFWLRSLTERRATRWQNGQHITDGLVCGESRAILKIPGHAVGPCFRWSRQERHCGCCAIATFPIAGAIFWWITKIRWCYMWYGAPRGVDNHVCGVWQVIGTGMKVETLSIRSVTWKRERWGRGRLRRRVSKQRRCRLGRFPMDMKVRRQRIYAICRQAAYIYWEVTRNRRIPKLTGEMKTVKRVIFLTVSELSMTKSAPPRPHEEWIGHQD